MSNNGFRYYAFKLPSFFDGLANIFDLGGTLEEYYSQFGNGYEEDLAALRSDWIVVGQDLRDAMATFEDNELPALETDEQS